MAFIEFDSFELFGIIFEHFINASIMRLDDTFIAYYTWIGLMNDIDLEKSLIVLKLK